MTHKQVMAGMLAPGLKPSECPGLIVWKRVYPMHGVNVHVHECEECHWRLETVHGAVVAVRKPKPVEGNPC